MWLVAVALAVFDNHWLFRWSPLASLVGATHGLIGGTLVANVIGLAIVVGGVLVAWGGARGRELGLCAADVPRAVATTIAIWAALNAGSVVADLWAGEPIELATGWRSPGKQVGDLAGQLLGNALYEEIVFRAVLVVQIARWIERGSSPIGRRALRIAVVWSQVIFALMHLPNRVAMGAWGSPADALVDLTWLWLDGAGLAIVWLRTRNLLVVVGLHALSNTPALLVAAPPWVAGIGVTLAFAVLIVLGRAPPPTPGRARSR